MLAAYQNINIERYADWSAIITLWQDEAKTKPVTLNSFTVAMKIRKNASLDSTVLATPTAVVYDAAKGQIRVSLTAAQTAAIPTSGETCTTTDYYSYDITITNATGIVTRVFNGYAKVSPGVTY